MGEGLALQVKKKWEQGFTPVTPIRIKETRNRGKEWERKNKQELWPIGIGPVDWIRMTSRSFTG